MGTPASCGSCRPTLHTDLTHEEAMTLFSLYVAGKHWEKGLPGTPIRASEQLIDSVDVSESSCSSNMTESFSHRGWKG